MPFRKVPNWAPKKSNFVGMSKPIEKYLRILMEAHDEMVTNSGVEVIEGFRNDEDLCRLCYIVENVRRMNWNICGSQIILNTGELYEDERSGDLINRIAAMRMLLENADDVPANERDEFFPPVEDHVRVILMTWKEDYAYHQSMPLFVELFTRLKKFHEKRSKIDFSSPALQTYNRALSKPRIDLNSICCRFLDVFLPPL